MQLWFIVRLSLRGHKTLFLCRQLLLRGAIPIPRAGQQLANNKRENLLSAEASSKLLANTDKTICPSRAVCAYAHTRLYLIKPQNINYYVVF